MILWPVVRTTEDTNMRLGAHLRVYQFAKRFIQNLEANSLQVECLFMVMTHIGRDLQQEAPGQVCSTYQLKSSLLDVHTLRWQRHLLFIHFTLPRVISHERQDFLDSSE